MKTHKGIIYYQGINGRWHVNHISANHGGYRCEDDAKRFIDKVTA